LDDDAVSRTALLDGHKERILIVDISVNLNLSLSQFAACHQD
jgi:hypothetical protein